MRKILYLLLALLGLGSCDIHTSGNGDLDGYWYLTQVDSLHNGKAVEYREQRVFWAITGGLMITRNISHSNVEEFVCHFEREGNTLRVGDIYLSDRVIGDRLIIADSLFALRPIGINAFHESFLIQGLSSSNMTLSGDMLRLHFEKY